jgi:hypothetical protein
LVKHLLGVSPGLERFQHLLLTHFPKVNLPGILRVSLGIENSEADVDTLIRVLGKIAGKPRTPVEQDPDSNINEGLVQNNGDVKKQMHDFVRKTAMKVYS